MSSIVAIATLLLRNACHFFRGKIARNGNIGLILASNVKYHFRFGISAQNLSPESNFSHIGPEIKNFEISKDMVPETKDNAITRK